MVTDSLWQDKRRIKVKGLCESRPKQFQMICVVKYDHRGRKVIEGKVRYLLLRDDPFEHIITQSGF